MSAKPRRRRDQIQEVSRPVDRQIGAGVASSARFQGARVTLAYSESLVDDQGDQYTPTVEDLAADLRRAIARGNAGNPDKLEGMLIAQAKALQAVFAHFAVKAAVPWSMALSPQYAAIAFKPRRRPGRRSRRSPK